MSILRKRSVDDDHIFFRRRKNVNLVKTLNFFFLSKKMRRLGTGKGKILKNENLTY